MKLYALRSDGSTYAGHIVEKMRAEMQARRQTGAVSLPVIPREVQKAVAAAGGVYWLAELTVPSTPRPVDVAD